MPRPRHFREFRRQITQIFRSPVQSANRTREDQRLWWKFCYQPWESQREMFLEDFLEDPDVSICRVTGQIGAGKTTFVLDKLENPDNRVCGGIWIDIGKYKGRLGEIQAEAYREYTRLFPRPDPAGMDRANWVQQQVFTELNKIVAENVEKRFRWHFWYLHCGLSPEYLGEDVWHRPEISCPEPSEDDFTLRAADVYRDTEAALVLARPDEDYAAIRASVFEATSVDTPPPRTEQLQMIRKYLEEYPDLGRKARAVDKKLNCSRAVAIWLRAYARFFSVQHLVLVLDDLDRVLSPELHGVVITYARSMADELQNLRGSGTVQSPGESPGRGAFKAIFTIRDWNIHTSPHMTGGVTQEAAITLGEEGKGYLGDGTSSVFLPFDRNLLGKIIDSRITVAEHTFADRDRLRELLTIFARAVKRVWDQDIESEEQFPVESLTNCSIRNALSFACKVALDLTWDSREEGRDTDEYLNADYGVVVRPRAIDWLFDTEAAGHNLGEFIRVEKSYIEEHGRNDCLCCTHRMTLTYLYRLENDLGPLNGRTKVGELIKHLNEYTNASEHRIRDTLHFLFQ